MAHVEIMKNVPNSEVPQLTAECKAAGALSVTAISQGNGLSTVTVTWPDAPLSAPAKAAVAKGADAAVVPAATAGQAGTMEAIAARLGCDLATVQAVSSVESSGTFFWNINGAQKPPVRLEAHVFGRLTGYQYNAAHPEISSTAWNPSLAATTRAGAYDQLAKAAGLNKSAALQACSWGAFQIMGTNWQDLAYASVVAMVDSMNTIDGQIDAFIRFVEHKAGAVAALKAHDWLTFAKLYNGPANASHYASKLQAAWISHQ